MNRHRRARFVRAIDFLNREFGWLLEPLFAVAIGGALALLLTAFIDAAIRAARL